jgi:hypothetical protein
LDSRGNRPPIEEFAVGQGNYADVQIVATAGRSSTVGETPPIGRGPSIPPAGGRKIKAPYQATIRWESADPIRTAEKRDLPAPFGGYYVLGIFFASAKDLGSKPVENLKQSAILLGKRALDAEIVQAHPGIDGAFLAGFPKTSMSRGGQVEFSARVGLLALQAKFNTGEMRYHGQLAL